MTARPTTATALLILFSASIISCSRSLSTASQPRTSSPSIRIGTRSSKLALAQAQKFQRSIREAARSGGRRALSTEIVCIDAAGDRGKGAPTQRLPLAVSGVDFTERLDDAVLNGTVDVAVHSLKDIPPECRWKAGARGNGRLVIGAYLGPRETPLDVLVTKDGSVNSIQTLPHGASMGSASIRRQSQLKATRRDLNVVNIRGNVDARLRSLESGETDALILAMAGLKRLGIVDDERGFTYKPSSKVSEAEQWQGKYHYSTIPIETMLPGLGQGLIAITCRGDNSEILSLLEGVDDYDARVAAVAEREYLDAVQVLSPWAGRPPVAGYMRRSENGLEWLFDGLVAAPDGSRVFRVHDVLQASTCSEENAKELGRRAGEKTVRMAGHGFLDGYY